MKSLLLLLTALTARADILAVPHPSCTFDAKHTVLWTPLFQAAWDALNTAQDGSGAKPLITPPNQVMDWLDGFAWKAEDVMPKNAWTIHAGPMNAALYNKANQEAQQRWGMQPFTYQNPATPGGYAALAMMVNRITFETPFDHAKFAALKFRSSNATNNVQFFGSLNAQELSSVEVLHYSQAAGSFALEARCKDADDRVIFYLPEKSSTFAEACQAVLQWKRRESNKQADGTRLKFALQENEVIRIPFVTLHSKADFTPLLQSQRVYPSSNTPFGITKAQQTILFQLDEKGATAQAIVEISSDPFATSTEQEPRVFDFDKPFFVFLWRAKAEWPYLALWLGDTSAMRVWEE